MKFFLFFFPLFAFCTIFSAEPDRKNWKWAANEKALSVTFELPAGYYAYAGNTRPVLMPAGKTLAAPAPVSKTDPVLGEKQEVFTGGKTYTWSFDLKSLKYPLSLSVEWQLCKEPGKQSGSEAICLMPGEAGLAVFETPADLYKKIEPPGNNKTEDPGEIQVDEQVVFLQKFKVLRRVSGYQSPKELRAFLRGDNISSFSFEDKGVLMSLLFALFGGLLLNLTPCVLPLIPVNLAVIGAGTNSQNPKKERFLRGCLYGAGIALTYGGLGIVAVLTGTTFGQLDSSWIFNGIAALIFLILGLAMFGVFHFDISSVAAGKFRMPSAAGRSGVFLMGALAAVLAGACVAPVIAAALVQAAKLSAHGNYAGLCLPLLVGLGMALPWPFAAAGIAFFPKPGGWMNYVKMGLGILILCLAAYYGWIAYRLLNPTETANDWNKTISYQDINNALTRSAAVNKPVLLDFGASWCKACALMEKNSFPDPDVQKELEHVILLKIAAEKPSEPATAELLKTFGVKGLPELLLIEPESRVKKSR